MASQPRRGPSSRAAASRANDANRQLAEQARQLAEQARAGSSHRPAPASQQQVQRQQAQRQAQQEEVAPQQGARARGKRTKIEEPEDEWQAPVIPKATWDDIMRCVVCREINLAPVLLCANSHTGLCCSTCAHRMKDREATGQQFKCPTCRTTAEPIRPVPRSHVAIMGVLFSTQTCENGCGARLTFDELRSHVDVCPKRTMQCPMCSLKVKACDFIDHQLNQVTHLTRTCSSVTHANAGSMNQFDFQLESEQSMRDLVERQAAYQIIEGVIGKSESFLYELHRTYTDHGPAKAREFMVDCERRTQRGEVEFASAYLEPGSFLGPGWSHSNLCRMWGMLHPLHEEHMVLISGEGATDAADPENAIVEYSARVALFIAPVSTNTVIESYADSHIEETMWVDFMAIESRQTAPVWLVVSVTEAFPPAAAGAPAGKHSCLTKTFPIHGTQKREIHPILDASCPGRTRTTAYIRAANLRVRFKLHVGSPPV